MEDESYPAVNRAALVVQLRKPFVDWLVATSREHDEGNVLTPEQVPTEGADSKTIYLIPEYNDDRECEKFLRDNFRGIFEQILYGWYTDRGIWPEDRSWEAFNEWFDWEVHSMVFDMGGDKIERE